MGRAMHVVSDRRSADEPPRPEKRSMRERGSGMAGLGLWRVVPLCFQLGWCLDWIAEGRWVSRAVLGSGG
jgi:hypothetical protein